MRLKSMVLSFALLSMGAALADEPVKYWFCGASGNSNISDANCLFEDSGAAAAAFVDGNWLCATAPSVEASKRTAWVPEHVNDRVGTAKWGGSIIFDRTTSAYGLFLQTGGRQWSLNKQLTVGAGGMLGNTGWNPLIFGGAGGLHLACSQTWEHANELDLEVPITAEPGTVWTFRGRSTSYRFVRFSFARQDFADIDVVVTGNSVIGLGHRTDAGGDGVLYAKSLTLSGAAAGFYLSARTDDDNKHPPRDAVIDARYSTDITLRDGVDLSQANYFDGAVLDPAVSFKIAGTGARLGQNAVYSVKDGGTFTIDIASGSTFTLDSLPTSGKLKITGGGRFLAGSADVVAGWDEVCDLTEFTGMRGGTLTFSEQSLVFDSFAQYDGIDVTFIDCAVRIKNVAGYSGQIKLTSNRAFHGQSYGQYKCTLALPPTAEWGADFAVEVGTRSMLYLPDVADEGISQKVTGPYTIGCLGWTKMTPGEHEFKSGDYACIIGDGFDGDSSIKLTGGTLYFPVNCVVAAPVTQLVATAGNNKYSTVGAGVRATVEFRGPFYSNTNASGLIISNNVSAYQPTDRVYVYEQGRVLFTGGGYMTASMRQLGGELEFAGGTWSCPYSNTPEMSIENYATYTRFTHNVTFTFGPGHYKGSTVGSREKGLKHACSAIYGRGMIVEKGSKLTIGQWRNIELGGGYTASSALLWAKGGEIKIEGPGGKFALSGTAPASLKNTSADRCAALILRATEGGAIELERILNAYPVTHAAPALETDNYANGQTACPGLHIELDGGTLSYGANFGVPDIPAHASLCRPFLFAQGLNLYDNNTYAPDYDHTAEIRFAVGTNGGALDLSRVTAYTTISNTVADTVCTGASSSIFSSTNYPNLGPRWFIDGPFALKGNGGQTFVINDSQDNAAFTNVTVDGIVVKVASDSDKVYDEIGFGEKPGAFVVEAKDGSAYRHVQYAKATVPAAGAFDASLLTDAVTIGLLLLEDGATVHAAGAGATLPQIGSAQLPNALGYFALPDSGSVAFAASQVEGRPTSWTRVEGSARRSPVVSATRLELLPRGTMFFLR